MRGGLCQGCSVSACMAGLFPCGRARGLSRPGSRPGRRACAAAGPPPPPNPSPHPPPAPERFYRLFKRPTLPGHARGGGISTAQWHLDSACAARRPEGCRRQQQEQQEWEWAQHGGALWGDNAWTVLARAREAACAGNALRGHHCRGMHHTRAAHASVITSPSLVDASKLALQAAITRAPTRRVSYALQARWQLASFAHPATRIHDTSTPAPAYQHGTRGRARPLPLGAAGAGAACRPRQVLPVGVEVRRECAGPPLAC